MSKHTKQPLSQLKEITDLKTVWKHEALAFTPWLFEKKNLELLSEAIGVEIEGEATEVGVGSFRVDIVGSEADTGRKVIIENQLEDTDHDHLGKIITYAAGQDAEIIVWVVKKAREEHRAAIEWLNNHTDTKIAFFLCEIKLYQIGNSPLAVMFDVIERPNGWIKSSPRDLSSTERVRYEYWESFCRYLEDNPSCAAEFTNKPKPCYDHWINLHIGTVTCHISLLCFAKTSEIGVSISIGNDQEYFDILESNKQTIEDEFGCELQWVSNPNKTARSVRLVEKVDMKNQTEREKQMVWFYEQAIKMKKIAKNYLK